MTALGEEGADADMRSCQMAIFLNHTFRLHTEVSLSISGHPHSSGAQMPKIDKLQPVSKKNTAALLHSTTPVPCSHPAVVTLVCDGTFGPAQMIS